MPAEEIPGIADYREALRLGLEAWRKKDNAKVIGYLEQLEVQAAKSSFEVLVVTDNGAGFSQRGMEAVLSEGTPEKQAGSSGSFGVGHLTAFGLSDLQYLLYIGKKPKATLFSGHAILASHSGDKKINCSAHGYFVKECTYDADDMFKFHDENKLSATLKSKYNGFIGETGSMICIQGFNYFGEDDNSIDHMRRIITKAVVTNFAIACSSGQLTVKLFGDHMISSDNIRTIADKLLHENPDDSKIEKTVANLITYQIANESHVNQVRLDDEFKDCQILIDTKADNHGVAFWRNGMLITRTHIGFAKSRFSDCQAFDAVIKLDGRQPEGFEPTSHNLIQDAETPMHDNIVTKLLKNDPADQRKLAKLLDAIRNKLYNLAAPLSSDEFGIDDILLGIGATGEFVRDDRKITATLKGGDDLGENGGRSGDESGGENKEIVNENEGEGSTSTTEGKGEKKRQTRKNISSHFKQLGKAVNPTSWKICFIPYEDRSNVKAHLFIDGGMDPSCAGKPVEDAALIKEVRLGNQSLPKVNGNTFEIGDVSAKNRYVLQIEFTSPVSHGKLGRCLDCRFSSPK